MTTVRHTDGLEISLSDGHVINADAGDPAGDVNVLSHAHGDHLYDNAPSSIICSELTAALAGVRRDEAPPTPSSNPDVTLLNAGHIPGSRAALITSERADDKEPVRILYTGDISTRDRFYLDGFDPVSVDILIIEATYGSPEFVFPPQEDLEAEIVDWFEDTADQPAICMGYSLGRAQEIQRLASRAGRTRLLVSDAIADINETIESHIEVEFEASRYTDTTELVPGDVLVLPAQTNHLSFVDSIRDSTDALKAGFSGWAIDSSYKYQGDYDDIFILSDHCDHSELLDVVNAADPQQVYVTHGSTTEFASYLTKNTSYEAQSLEQNQKTLGDY